jgi:RHS repeat-associated protein
VGVIAAYTVCLCLKSDFNGKTTTFAYDTINRLTSKTADPTHPSLISHAIARVEYDYDANGARIAARTYSAGNALLYSEATPRDERGRLISKTTPFGTLGYDYYANGLLKDVVSSNSGGVNTGYRYDEANRLAFVDDASGVQPVGTPNRTTGYTYNANGSLQSVAAANGVTHTYQYDTLNRLRTLNVSNLSSQIGSYTYALNPSGHRHQVTEGTGRTVAYTYDALYRLTSETVAGGADPGQNGTVTYGLDKVGNRESRTSSVSSVAASSNTYNSRDWLSGDTYDTNGNTRTTPLTALGSPLTIPDVYDFEDRLIVRTRSDGMTINLSYDADGIRLQKSIFDVSASLLSATGYFVDTNNLTGYAQVLEEYANTSAGTTASVYTYGSSLISVGRIISNAPSSTFSYFAFDGLGSVRALTNATGAVTDTYDYDAFGILIRRTGTTTNNYLYRGEQFDPDLGMYSVRARFYNQSTGRFWNQDSYEGSSGDPASLHKYLYANADPVMGRDPSGHFSLIEEEAVVEDVGVEAEIATPEIRGTISPLAKIVIGAKFAEATAGILKLVYSSPSLQRARDDLKLAIQTESRDPILYFYGSKEKIFSYAFRSAIRASSRFPRDRKSALTFPSGAYATDIAPFETEFTQRQLSAEFYNGDETQDVSWFIAFKQGAFRRYYKHQFIHNAPEGTWIPIEIVLVGPNLMSP